MRHFPNHVALGVSNRLIQERSHILEYTALHSGLRTARPHPFDTKKVEVDFSKKSIFMDFRGKKK